MGIPKFFRWLSDRYPLVNQHLDESHVFDHFYLDMNGIIHQCTHNNNNEIASADLDTMFERIFAYTERLYRIVAPRKLLYLAVDGVAPRAKMNQQRSRRFRAARDAERAMADAIAAGVDVPTQTPFDSNCITPGTHFMHDLSQRFKKWLQSKLENDPNWQQGCDVVFSGSEVPGEGEHKICDWIRSWKASEDYDPAIRHCMYGLDADLIMLALVAHTPHFSLLREKQTWRKGKKKSPSTKLDFFDAEEFQLLEIALLKDMLFLEFKRALTGANGQLVETDTFRLSPERIADDFVFMCMLVGNDFIPNIPHLDIADGALALMFRTYKALMPRWKGYLTDAHRLHPVRLETFFMCLAAQEFRYFEIRGFDDEIEEYKDKDTYRAHYYSLKFNVDITGPSGDQFVKMQCQNYVEGLHWVLQYYHKGCPSWSWYYPEFYAPLASDMKSLRDYKVRFHKGRPFGPLTQLLAVLPPESAEFLPNSFQQIMVSEMSAVKDFYPTQFNVDQNGKRNAWEAIVLIPFIDEIRLLEEVKSVNFEEELDEIERQRNSFGSDHWWRADDFPRANRKLVPLRPFIPYKPSSERRNGSPSSPTRKRNLSRTEGNGALPKESTTKEIQSILDRSKKRYQGPAVSKLNGRGKGEMSRRAGGWANSDGARPRGDSSGTMKGRVPGSENGKDTVRGQMGGRGRGRGRGRFLGRGLDRSSGNGTELSSSNGTLRNSQIRSTGRGSPEVRGTRGRGRGRGQGRGRGRGSIGAQEDRNSGIVGDK